MLEDINNLFRKFKVRQNRTVRMMFISLAIVNAIIIIVVEIKERTDLSIWIVGICYIMIVIFVMINLVWWKITVVDNSIKYSPFLLKHKKYTFSDITVYKEDINGLLRVYSNSKKLFTIQPDYENIQLFEMILRRNNIEKVISLDRYSEGMKYDNEWNMTLEQAWNVFKKYKYYKVIKEQGIILGKVEEASLYKINIKTGVKEYTDMGMSYYYLVENGYYYDPELEQMKPKIEVKSPKTCLFW